MSWLICSGDVVQDGQTALSIAENVGHKPVVDVLKDVTDVVVSPATKKRKFNLAVPETMQEAALSDLEDEGNLTLTVSNQIKWNRLFQTTRSI